MLLPRVMPCLLLQDEELVKTAQFKSPKYVGDPVNVISIFNDLEVDEIVLLDIGATKRKKKPDFDVIRRVANECMMPMAYGGGIAELADIQTVLEIGVEKVILNSAAVRNPNLVREAAKVFGSQAIVVSIDARKRLLRRGYEVYTESGSRATGRSPVEQARIAEDLGAGEILLTSIEREGTMKGYDLDLVAPVCQAVSIPVIANGGAGAREDLGRPIREAGASAAAAGALFVFQGPSRGVLINFPERHDLERILGVRA